MTANKIPVTVPNEFSLTDGNNQLEGASAAYNMPGAFELSGLLNVDAIKLALGEILQRHEVLRTCFQQVDGVPVQVIDQNPLWNLPIVDLQQVSEPEVEAQRLASVEAQTPFDLSQSPIVRVSLLRLQPQKHVLLINMHHIASDGWSSGIFIRELSILYTAFCQGERPSLPELAVQYADFAVWQRQWLANQVLERQLSYWMQQLAGAPPLVKLPTDRPRPPVQTFCGGKQHVKLDVKLTQQLRQISQKSRTTLFMTLLAGFVVLLYRYSGQTDLVVGSPIANRNRREIEGLIGFFVNTLALRFDLSQQPTFETLLAQVRQVTQDAYDHQDLPFEMLMEKLQLERSLDRNPLVQVVFALQNAPASDWELPGLKIENLAWGVETVRVDIELHLREVAEGIEGFCVYNRDLFDAATIACMMQHFQILLEALALNPQQPVELLPLLTQQERHKLLVEWNDTFVDYACDRCIHQLFEEQVERVPDAVAVVFENQQLTYRELNSRANQLGHYLKSLGVGTDVLVGLCVERSIEIVVGLLGILKAGGAYVPLDPEYPTERLLLILEDTQISVLLTQKHLVEQLPKHQATQVFLEQIWSEIVGNNQDNPTSGVTPTHLANVIYTSGSTGKPKGVMVENRGLCNLAIAQIQAFGLQSDSRILQFASLNFDASISEIIMAFGSGATLYLGSKHAFMPGAPLIERLRDYGITHITLPPSALAVMPVEQLPTLQTMIVAGEASSAQLIRHWAAGRNFFNAYGPTETTVCATIAKCTPLDEKISIGRPIANTQVYILDSHLQPVPVGVPGELHIGGVGLARGYLNRPELTLETFIPNPFSTEVNSRLYRTGDLARYLADGNIEYLGRLDNQVKIRGFRIELGEIEAVLSQHPLVQESVVISTTNAFGEQSLVAYLVPGLKTEVLPQQLAQWQSEYVSDWQTLYEQAYGQSSASTDDVTFNITGWMREFVQQKLPNYMVPSTFVLLNALPLTPNGKVDHRALPTPDIATRNISNGFVSPRTPIEAQLIQIWSEVLGVEHIGVNDNFFELGGHSLTTIRVVSQVNETFQIKLPLRHLFTAPTIAELAQIIEFTSQADSTVTANKITTVNLQAEVVLDQTINSGNLAYQPVSEPRAIFLTGATGFVGAFLLTELLQQTQADIYCLVRAANFTAGKQRLEDNLKTYLLWEASFNSRIIPVLGDLSQPLLGLSDEQFHLMARKINLIYHNGALVNHVYPYALLKATNIRGTEEVLRLASQIKIKPVHFISTLSVFASDEYFKLEIVKENDPLEYSQGLLGGYAQSKWVAEKMVMIARDRGLPCSIYRLGRITWHSQTGVWNPNDLFYRFIKSCIQLKSAPEMNSLVEITPVDYLAKVLINLSQQPKALDKAFHLTNSHSAPWSQFFDCIRSLGYPLQQLSYEDWQAELLRSTQNSTDNALYSFVSLAGDNTSSELKPNATSSLKFDCQNTLNGLANTAIRWPEIDNKLLQAFVSSKSASTTSLKRLNLLR